jgi:hypothetical protein
MLAIELGIPLVEECETLKRELEEENNGSNDSLTLLSVFR